QEAVLTPSDLVQPMFVVEGKGVREPIGSMPGQSRVSVDVLVEEGRLLAKLGIPGIALFPRVSDAKKDEEGTESYNDDGLIPTAVKALKDAAPELMVVCDVALDPFTSSGQDGIVVDGEILNDRTVAALIEQALCEARAGADIVAPSDM